MVSPRRRRLTLPSRIVRPFNRRRRQHRSSVGVHHNEYGSSHNEENPILSERGTSVTRSDRPSVVSPHLTDDCSTIHSDQSAKQDRYREVRRLEGFSRQVLIYVGVYLFGVWNPQLLPYAMKVMEWFGLAWITCIVLIIMVSVKKYRTLEIDDDEEDNDEETLFIDNDRNVLLEDTKMGPSRSILVEEHAEAAVSEVQHHPDMEQMYFMNINPDGSSNRVFPNSTQSIPIENDYMVGKMIVLLRTPDVDDPNAALGTEHNSVASKFFRGKLRRWEIHYQVRLKQKPEGRVFFAIELKDVPKMGMIQRTFVGAAMNFCKRLNNGFHYCTHREPETPDGRYQKPHTAFQVKDGFNRIVATPPGQIPPKLGGDIHEDPESIKRRKQSNVDWNTTDTYTMAVWSAYVDFLQWQTCNIPGVKPVQLTTVIGMQKMNCTLYLAPHPEKKKPDKHLVCDITLLCNHEISNTCQGGALGPCAKQWIAKNKQKANSCENGYGKEGDLPDVIVQEEEEDDDEFDDDDEETVAELGEGMYLRSGDNIVLREFSNSEAGVDGCCVTNGNGFAVLQNQSSYYIVIEKARRSRARSKLIKNGDYVMIKLVSKNKTGEQTDIKYLSIHRGWWLKWVSILPTKNGYFVVHTHDVEYDGKSLQTSETQNSYLTLGGTFWLRHRRWSKYQVGISVEESPTFGGRMLGLYRNTMSNVVDEPLNPDDEDEGKLESDDAGFGSKAKNKWMRPLHLCAQISASSNCGLYSHSPRNVDDNMGANSPGNAFPFLSSDQTSNASKLLVESSELDVPAWIEMMNRTKRRTALVYVVRGRQVGSDNEEFVRLRTGRNLAEIIRHGRSWSILERTSGSQHEEKEFGTPRDISRNNSCSSYESKKADTDSPECVLNVPSLEREKAAETSPPFENGCLEIDSDEAGSDNESSVGSEESSIGEDYDESILGGAANQSSPRRRRKGRKLIGQIKRSMKAGTNNTGKRVKSAGKKVGKGTVTARKAIISPIALGGALLKKPPAREPKSKRLRKKQRDHVVVDKAMKSMSKKKKLRWLSQRTSVLAGQLSAPEQSCRTVSHVLTEMSNLPASSAMSINFSSMLSAQLASHSDLDRWLLQGSSIELGVVPSKSDQKLVHDCLVVRCLWESHWREEWCGVYENVVAFHAALSKKPFLEISFEDIQAIRPLDPAFGASPLPGMPLLVIETAWRCHYVAFSTEESRGAFSKNISDLLFLSPGGAVQRKLERKSSQTQLKTARFWQGFQNSVDSSISGDISKWAKVSSSKKRRTRTIMNRRRMEFDIDSMQTTDEETTDKMWRIGTFVENLLATALTFTLDSLEEDPDEFVKFLDSTSQLRSLSLQDIDFASKEAFCLFVNLYHCLLQHAMLLSLNGPLHKRSFETFMRCTCYEIGGDVFSLAELHSCMIRGKMSRTVSPKPPYIEAPKKSNAYRFYALDYMDPRSNFLVNTGDLSCSSAVSVVRPHQLEEQFQEAAGIFIRSQLFTDNAKKHILLPKVFDVYRNDFGTGDPTSSFMYCLKYLKEEEQSKFLRFLKDDATIKFQPNCDQYYEILQLQHVTM